MRVMHGDIWLTDLRPTVGREQAGQRPALVISNYEYNTAIPGLVIIAPLTTIYRNWSTHIRINPEEGTGLQETSWVMAEQIKSISRLRLKDWWGTAPKGVLDEVSEWAHDML